MVILICGGRDIDERIAYSSIDFNIGLHNIQPSLIITGGCKGVDSAAEKWALDNGVPVKVFVPKWREYGKLAGPLRNKQMLHEGKPSIVLAIGGGKGTQNTIKQAHEIGIEIIHLQEY